MLKNRTYIILLVIIIAFFGMMFYFFGLDSYKEGKKTATLIYGDNTIWNLSNKKWSNISNSVNVQKLAWKKYHVYTNGEKVGNYYLWHDDKWYAFDNKKNAVSLDGDLFAYRSNYDIDVINVESEDVGDNDQYISTVLANKNIKETTFSSRYKVSIDYDNDNEIEDFYVISNAFLDNYAPEVVFSIVFMVKNEEIYPIYENIGGSDEYNGCKPYFQNFIDIDEDSSYEFVLSCGYYSDYKRTDMLYHFVDNEFKIMISN